MKREIRLFQTMDNSINQTTGRTVAIERWHITHSFFMMAHIFSLKLETRLSLKEAGEGMIRGSKSI